MKRKLSTILLMTLFCALFACTKSEITSMPIAVQSVVLNKSATSILEGAKETLTATVAPTEAENKAVAWSTSDASIATVSATGEVSGVKVGTATITVTTDDGKKRASCVVTVSATSVGVTGVTLDKTTTTLAEGTTSTLVVTVAPATATNQNITWSTSDASIATVSATGEVSGVKVGTATITVTTDDGKKRASCVVTVSATSVGVTGVTLNSETMTVAVAATSTLTATVAPIDATNQAVIWSSADALIATVSDQGVVTAIKAGTVLVTATTVDGGCKATCTVTVVDYVEAGGLKWASGNLVTNGTNGCKIGAPTDYGLYFHFGSLVGWSGGANGDGTGTGKPALALQVMPVGYNGGTAWTTAGRYTGGTADSKDNGLPTADDPTTGIGDPCRYYLGGTWSTPTADEWLTLLGTDGANTNKGAPLTVNNTALSFPASGNRSLSDGTFFNVGSYGYCWSSSVSDATSGHTLYFYSGFVNPQSYHNRSNGMPVRCVAPL